MKKIHIVVGTRPEAIKMAPLVKELQKNQAVQTTLISTGQHRELLSGALASFGLRADVDLAVMTKGQSLSSLTAAILVKLENYFVSEAGDRPSLVLAHGDTTTAFATALSCQYHRIPLAHVEAGLRSHDLASPFPEEFNRRSIAALAQHHFAPGVEEEANLLSEGVASKRVSVVGNTIADAVDSVLEVQSPQRHPLVSNKNSLKKNVLVTLHRRESAGARMRAVLDSLRAFAESRKDDVVLHFPVHPNPHLQREVAEALGGIANTRLLPPLEYPKFLALLMNCSVVLTDSGGVQEEAALLGKPVLIYRDRTERKIPETGALVDAVSVYAKLAATLRSSTAPQPTLATQRGASRRIALIVGTMLQRGLIA